MALNADFFVKMPLSQKLLILLTIVAIMVLGYWFGINTNQVETLRQKECKLFNLDARHKHLKKLEKYKNELEAENTMMQEKIDELKRQLPTDLQMEDLIDKFSDLADARGLTIELLKPGKVNTKEQSYDQYPIELKVQGDYVRMMDFWYEVTSKQERIITFSNIQMKIDKGGSSLNVNCDATAYKFKEDTKKTGGDKDDKKKGRRGRRRPRGGGG